MKKTVLAYFYVRCTQKEKKIIIIVFGQAPILLLEGDLPLRIRGCARPNTIIIFFSFFVSSPLTI